MKRITMFAGALALGFALMHGPSAEAASAAGEFGVQAPLSSQLGLGSAGLLDIQLPSSKIAETDGSYKVAQRRRRGARRGRGRRGRGRRHGHGIGVGTGLAIGGAAILGGIIASEAAKSNRRAYRRCADRYDSFDPDSGTIIRPSGREVLCPYLR